MNVEIKKQNWAVFFKTVSRRRSEWKTKIEILDADIGHQILVDGMPLNGITVESRNGKASIELSVGVIADDHVTHTIEDPSKVAFLGANENGVDVIEIENTAGKKALITFVEPMGLLIGYEEFNVAAKAV